MKGPTGKWVVFDDRDRNLDRFGLLLLVTTLAVATLLLVDVGSNNDDLKSELGALLVTLCVGATLLLAQRASGVSRRYRIIADIAISVGVVATLLVTLAPLGLPNTFPPALWLILAPLAPLVVIRRLIHHDRATGKTLLGAVSAFLLIALAFTFFFLVADQYQTGTFFEAAEPTTSFMYYSLVTVTTLGYGDLAAVGEVGRAISVLEAVVGQVYLVTFVGMIVGLLVARREDIKSERRRSQASASGLD